MDDFYIRKVLAGDKDAFRYFLNQYKDMAFTVAMSVVKDEFAAQEIVQDSFVKVFIHLKRFNKKSSFRTWFYRIVVNESLMRLKKLEREIIFFAPDYKDEIVDETAILSLQKDEQNHLINEALQMLLPKESLVLRLFYLQEESIKQVCEITGWTETNTKVLLHRARKHMLMACKKIMEVQFKNVSNDNK